MTTTLDARQHAEALKTALRGALNSDHAYDYDELPGGNGKQGHLPNIFALISVELVPGSSPRMTGQTSARRWIGSVRCVGRTIDEARWALWKAAEALNERVLVVGYVATSPLQMEPGQAPEYDDGRYAGLFVFTYSH